MGTSALGETFYREVTFAVSSAEQSEKKDELVLVDEEIDKVAGQKAAQSAEYNSLLKDLRKNRSEILRAIKSGHQTKRIEVYEKKNEQLGQIETYRADNHEILEELTRPMTSAERQLTLDDALGSPDDEYPEDELH